MVMTKKAVINNRIPVLISWEYPFVSKVVLLFHSFLHSKEDMLPFSHKLAQKGYLCINVDIDRHGDRENYQDQFPWQSFYDVVFQTANEIPIILDQLEAWKGEKLKNIATLGVSMGGMISLSAPIIDKRVVRVVSILSSGNYSELSRVNHATVLRRFFSDNQLDKESYYRSIDENAQLYDPIHHLSVFRRVCLLMINGTMDNVIPIASVEKFQKILSEQNRDFLQNYEFVKIPGAGHELMNRMVSRAIDWML